MKYDMYELPESLYEFAQISDFHGVIEDLAAMAEDEDWNYHNTTSTSDLPILENYIRNTYIRLSREKKIAYSTDSKFCCFDTGLLSRIQHEPIYMQFCENTNPRVCFKTIKLTKAKCKREKQPHGSRRLFSHTA